MADKRSIFNKKAKTYAVHLNSTLAGLSFLAIILVIALVLSVVWLFSGNDVNKNIIAQRPDASSSQANDVSSGGASSQKWEADDARFSKPLPESDMRETAYFNDAVFVGDSITTGIDLYSSLTNTKVVASTGINLETVLTADSVRNKAGDKVTIPAAVKELKPAKIYLMLGTNGLDWMSVDQMVAQYEKVFDKLKADNPDAIFYIQSIPPITKEKEQNASQMSISKIKEYNLRLLTLAESKKAYFVDVYSAIASEDGYLSPDISTDGVHFESSVYVNWIEYVRRHTSRYE
ncbi:MAG: hypothetical protein IJ027_06020 [Oscillospiraceae bacterium]|nr:hypothetical protein [Oscillospiraceae bacterium]